MASIFSNVIVLFVLACMSTLSSADPSWFRARNTTFLFSSRHKRPRFPPPPSRCLPQPPWRCLPPSPPPSRPRQPRTPPPSRPQKPRTPPSRPRQPRTPPPRRPRTPPPRWFPPLPPRPRTPPSSPLPTPQNPRKIIVGGSKYWRLGFDYNDWILKNGPFYVNDILVFKYDPPNSSTPPHNVYLLPNMQSLNKCDFRRAKLVANLTQGSGNGFNFVLKQQKAYYFACGEGNGFHCNLGSMKFSITPQSRCLPSPPPPSRPPRIPPPRHVPPPSKRPRIPPPRQVPPSSPPPPSKRPRIPPPRPMPPQPMPPPPSLPPSPSPSPSPSPPPSPTPQIPRKIIVGGSEQWRLGFDYNDWALKNGPFYLNDILVFKYDRTHSVYLLPNMQSLVDCDFGTAKMVANLTQGSGDGFEFVLNQQNPYYFACGEGNGFHCKLGSMKFSVTPIAQA
ncbi:extensin-like isoform X2 [Cucurbita moschata]|uniref:Extensin-like isoform X2 n=1 Tax=Cucurbita moschata TaxID=3662 RepID=A0A6J1G5G3_CUCMO|nr:extensin-like isoform X2 [Cucurbita moschata]